MSTPLTHAVKEAVKVFGVVDSREGWDAAFCSRNSIGYGCCVLTDEDKAFLIENGGILHNVDSGQYGSVEKTVVLPLHVWDLVQVVTKNNILRGSISSDHIPFEMMKDSTVLKFTCGKEDLAFLDTATCFSPKAENHEADTFYFMMRRPTSLNGKVQNSCFIAGKSAQQVQEAASSGCSDECELHPSYGGPRSISKQLVRFLVGYGAALKHDYEERSDALK